jgi:NET1-associated nuclear protein 1 (U3 small nucleolar RNA-associated protein 17)
VNSNRIVCKKGNFEAFYTINTNRFRHIINPKQRFNAKMELTCIAIHPSEDCIATGTTSGKIILWYNYLACMIENERSKSNVRTKPTMNILHWHSLPVLSLTFSLEGSYLLSGGHECVLVKWMFKSGQKDFKPRLGAPINALACSNDNTLYVTKHLDNTIHLIGTNLNVIQTFSGFLCPKFCSKQFNDTLYPVGLKYFKPLNCFITNGKPGHLQFYAFNSDKLIFNLDIVDENYISPENLNRPNVHTEIEMIDFNHDCTWLATVERRDDSVTTPEIRLKFWMFDKVNNKFSLNTLVRYPHSFEKVNKLKFKPNENILFTCGNDACFKSWILCENRKTGMCSLIFFL